MSTNLNPQIALAKVMARYGVAFNIGADILNKGSRTIDKYLGSEEMTGDTVNVPIWDSGEVYNHMDLTGRDLTVERGYVPVTVKPLVAAATLTVEDLTLSVKSPEHMVKRVVKQADMANLIAFRTLIEQSQAHVVPPNLSNVEKANAIRYATFAASATAEGSKLGGQTYGCTHPMTWKHLIASLATNFAPNDKLGSKLYSSELGDYMGYKWCKGSSMAVIDSDPTSFGNVTLYNGSARFDYTTTPTGTSSDPIRRGKLSDPFTVAGLYNCDAIGLKTGELKTLRAVYNEDSGEWSLVTPLFLSGSRQNAWYNGAPSTISGQAISCLQPNTQYFAPAVVWKEADFLVAVKGLEKFHGSDSFTIPTEYKEKGILPLRGSVFTDVVKASTLFRVDVLLGTAMYQGISAASVYIPVNTSGTGV